MESWAIPLVSGAAAAFFGFASVWLGLKARRRLGLPTPLDEQIQEQERKLRDALKDAEARCQADLEEARRTLDEERRHSAAVDARLTLTIRELDEQKLYSSRLELRILNLEKANGSAS